MKNSEYFKPLTGVRAIAAYMVFLHHMNPFQGTWLFDFTAEFHTGVTIFFVLSGFLIAYRYSDMENFSWRQYMVNRIARIYPVYFALTTLTFGILFLKETAGFRQLLFTYLANITFLRGFFDDLKFTGIVQGWSLTVEETFYILAPLSFLMLLRNRLYVYVLPVLFLAFGFGMVLLFSPWDWYGFFGSGRFMLNYTFFGRCIEFFLGIGLAMYYKSATRESGRSVFTYGGLLLMAAVIWLISASRFQGDSVAEYGKSRLLLSVVLPLVGVVPFFLGLLTERTWVSRVLGSRLLVLLGKSSYVFYLIHLGFVNSTLEKVSHNIFFLFLVLNLISILVFLYYEEPMNRYIRRRFGKGKPDAVTGT